MLPGVECAIAIHHTHHSPVEIISYSTYLVFLFGADNRQILYPRCIFHRFRVYFLLLVQNRMLKHLERSKAVATSKIINNISREEHNLSIWAKHLHYTKEDKHFRRVCACMSVCLCIFCHHLISYIQQQQEEKGDIFLHAFCFSFALLSRCCGSCRRSVYRSININDNKEWAKWWHQT